MDVNTLKLRSRGFPEVLRNIPSPPKQIFYSGANPETWIDKPRVAVVGSRKATAYGLQVTDQLAGQLAKVGVVIISGLAYGIDAAAHKAALTAGGITVVVLPTSLDQIYPSANQYLARKVIEQAGTLISEYPTGVETYRSNFIERNRLVSGLADILLITEAAVNSGSLHTARFALEQGKTVMTVPGNIDRPSSEGCNNLIKSGAVPVAAVEDIFFALNIRPKPAERIKLFQGNSQEKAILELITKGIHAQEELALFSKLDGATISSVLTMLEISGHIRSFGAGNWVLV